MQHTAGTPWGDLGMGFPNHESQTEHGFPETPCLIITTILFLISLPQESQFFIFCWTTPLATHFFRTLPALEFGHLTCFGH